MKRAAGALMLLALWAGIASAQFKIPDQRSARTGINRREPFGMLLSLPGVAPASGGGVAGVIQLPRTINFDPNFASSDAANCALSNNCASCGTFPTFNETFNVKCGASQIGQIALSGAPSLVNFWTGSATGSGSSGTVATSTGNQMLAGDVLVAGLVWFQGVALANGACGFPICGGANGTWTAAVATFTDSPNLSSAVYYHVVSASDIGATFTVTWSGGSFAAPALVAFRGVKQSAPLDVAGTGSTGNTATNMTAAGISTTHTNDIVIWLGGTDAATTSLAVPTNFTQLWNVPWASAANEGTIAGYLTTYQPGTAESGTAAPAINYTAVLTGFNANVPVSCLPTYTTSGGAPQFCGAGSRLEVDWPNPASGADLAITILGHTQ